MAKKTTKNIDVEDLILDETNNIPTLADALETSEVKSNSDVVFTQEQWDVINKLIAGSKQSTPTDKSVSMYNVRDKKKIETVNVSRFDGKFVIGFENKQNDPYEEKPKYYEMKLDVVRKLPDQPFVTLLLSNDGKEIEKKEVSLVDYVNYRKKFKANVVKIETKDFIDDYGLLGKGSSEFARISDESGKNLPITGIKAEVKRTEMVFYVELPGFDKPVQFISDYLA